MKPGSGWNDFTVVNSDTIRYGANHPRSKAGGHKYGYEDRGLTRSKVQGVIDARKARIAGMKPGGGYTSPQGPKLPGGPDRPPVPPRRPNPKTPPMGGNRVPRDRYPVPPRPPRPPRKRPPIDGTIIESQ